MERTRPGPSFDSMLMPKVTALSPRPTAHPADVRVTGTLRVGFRGAR
jgi:hypothetical protein